MVDFYAIFVENIEMLKEFREWLILIIVLGSPFVIAIIGWPYLFKYFEPKIRESGMKECLRRPIGYSQEYCVEKMNRLIATME
jgi:hypothetical protein